MDQKKADPSASPAPANQPALSDFDSQGDGRWLEESDREDEPHLTPEPRLWALERRQANNREGKDYAQDVAKDPQEMKEWDDEIECTQEKIDQQKEEIKQEEAASGEAASGEEASGGEASGGEASGEEASGGEAAGGEAAGGGTGSNESGSLWDSEKVWEWIKDIIPFSILVNNLFFFA